MNRCVIIGAALLGLTTTACSGAGELGNGSFHYVCTTEHDFSCDQLGAGSLDAGPVAVGAMFDLEFLRASSERRDAFVTGRFAGVEPASTQVAERVADSAQSGFRFKTHGEGAFLARGSDGSVVDFVHLVAEPVEDVQLSHQGVRFGEFNLAAGETQTVTAYPLGFGGEHLIGSMQCTWSTEDETVARPPAASRSCEIDIEALAEGTTTLHVQMNDTAEADITVTVGAAQ